MLRSRFHCSHWPSCEVHVRTAQHPTLAGLPSSVQINTFDHVYERTKRLEDVYPEIASELLENALALADGGHIVYAVPGDPCVAENSVAILRAGAFSRGVRVRTIPGLSFLAGHGRYCSPRRRMPFILRNEGSHRAICWPYFLEPTLAAVGVDMMPSLCIVDAIDVARAGHAVGVSVDAPLLLCQLYSRAVASDVKLTLMQQYPEEWPVSLVHAAGTKDEVVEVLPLCDIDRSEHIG